MFNYVVSELVCEYTWTEWEREERDQWPTTFICNKTTLDECWFLFLFFLILHKMRIIKNIAIISSKVAFIYIEQKKKLLIFIVISWWNKLHSTL